MLRLAFSISALLCLLAQCHGEPVPADEPCDNPDTCMTLREAKEYAKLVLDEFLEENKKVLVHDKIEIEKMAAEVDNVDFRSQIRAAAMDNVNKLGTRANQLYMEGINSMKPSSYFMCVSQRLAEATGAMSSLRSDYESTLDTELANLKKMNSDGVSKLDSVARDIEATHTRVVDKVEKCITKLAVWIAIQNIHLVFEENMKPSKSVLSELRAQYETFMSRFGNIGGNFAELARKGISEMEQC
ncbi:UNVERIFIED_CONTAM: hypothetical protein PYX00_002559 [Menopon gallinae]|uniref:Secreted protein n=1 Tax=Menopon gallinae TaxID=328185 RepID=A0AAW2IIK3_9NEOP